MNGFDLKKCFLEDADDSTAIAVGGAGWIAGGAGRGEGERGAGHRAGGVVAKVVSDQRAGGRRRAGPQRQPREGGHAV